MKYVLTGSTGNITKPLAATLLAAGHEVTIITSSPSRKEAIESLGAKAAIGSLLEASFVTDAFSGADAVYLMIPPTFAVSDWLGYQKQIGENFVTAIKESGVKYVVQLSSIGAHMGQGAGPIDGLAYLEKRLETMDGINVLKLRPSYFYTNFYNSINLIKHAGILGSNMGNGDQQLVLTHPNDIAAVAVKYLVALDFKAQSVVYISSDIRSLSEIAKVLGDAIGRLDLPWIGFSDADALQGMRQSGLPEVNAKEYVQMGKSIREGLIQEDYFNSNEQPQGTIKLEDFAKEFAQAYNS
ncbi:NAD(P)H-binding protein [Flavobacterium sp. 25HG05S-40]|uniref:NAD(P)H-binding protein n=1 Tax=Flavobacterium sp. 25HG05S-40 TaxID=3458682 RepID=UPI0040450945